LEAFANDLATLSRKVTSLAVELASQAMQQEKPIRQMATGTTNRARDAA
jgi:hypothetical protein